ncbi:hypothetical protein HK100_001585, partial [Physocladia obscura]
MMIILMGILTLFAFLNFVGLFALAAASPVFWIFLLLSIGSLAVDAVGLYAIWKIHPEAIVAFGWGLIAQFGVAILQFIIDIAVFGPFATFPIFGVFVSGIFTLFLLSTLYPLRRYGLTLRAANDASGPELTGIIADNSAYALPVVYNLAGKQQEVVWAP